MAEEKNGFLRVSERNRLRLLNMKSDKLPSIDAVISHLLCAYENMPRVSLHWGTVEVWSAGAK